MIPDPKQIDPDLVKMFNDVPNSSLKQTIVPTIVNVPKDHIESSRSVWAENTNNLLAFEYGYMLGSSGDKLTKPDTKQFLTDLFRALRQCLTNETLKLDSTEKSHDIFLAMQHMINILSEKYKVIENGSTGKINTDAIIASFHGFITSYIISNYKPNIKK